MTVKEFGTENGRTIMLLHGGGLSWWSFRAAALQLAQDYHVVLPVLDGHAGSDRDFTSIKDNAAELIGYIDARFGGSVLLIGGLSLGGQILVEMLAQRKDICAIALVESALVLPMKMTRALVAPMMSMSCGLIKKKWFARLQFRALGIREDLYDEYYRDTCLITKDNMTAFLRENAAYEPAPSLAQTGAEVYICVGGREQPIMKRSARKLHRLIRGSTLEINKGLRHGEFSINYAQDYVRCVRGLIDSIR